MELVKSKSNLPANIKDLTKFVLIGREKLVAVRAEIRAIEKMDLAKEVREQKKEEAQDLAGALLDAEVKIGELLKNVPKYGKKEYGSSGGTIPSLPEGISKKQSHYFQIMAAHPEIVERVKMEAAENDDLPTRTEVIRKIREEVKKEDRKDMKRLIIPQDEFEVIYADPPWQYSNSGFEMSAENKYPTMSIQEMIEQIKFKTSENAVLFLWVTNPLLKECFPLIQSWGFEYKTNFVWIKKNHTAGFYVYGQHELLLICTKGTGNLPIEKYKSIIEGENNIHSKKPESVYEIIEKMYPNKKYLELFARNERQGWTSYGNEL